MSFLCMHSCIWIQIRIRFRADNLGSRSGWAKSFGFFWIRIWIRFTAMQKTKGNNTYLSCVLKMICGLAPSMPSSSVRNSEKSCDVFQCNSAPRRIPNQRYVDPDSSTWRSQSLANWAMVFVTLSFLRCRRKCSRSRSSLAILLSTIFFILPSQTQMKCCSSVSKCVRGGAETSRLATVLKILRHLCFFHDPDPKA